LDNNKEEYDGYGLRHLAAHLKASGQQEKLHCLLNWRHARGETSGSSQGGRGDTTGYINDIARAWRLAEKGYDPKIWIKLAGLLVFK